MFTRQHSSILILQEEYLVQLFNNLCLSCFNPLSGGKVSVSQNHEINCKLIGKKMPFLTGRGG